MSTQSFLFYREPDWRPHRPGCRQNMPETVQSWIYEGGSLTARLRDFSDTPVQVKILFHQWQLPFLDERTLLHVPGHRYCLTREVMLQNSAYPLILARTIIPEQTIKGAHRNLSHLGIRPLGEVIFSYPKLERLAMDVAEIGPHDWLPGAAALAGINQAIWGRRTVYAIAHRPMVVSEFFLPGIL